MLGRLEAVTLFLSQLEDKSFKVMRSLLLKWRESRVSASPATRGRSRPRQEACPPILPAPPTLTGLTTRRWGAWDGRARGRRADL